jgi:hypothetical protein
VEAAESQESEVRFEDTGFSIHAPAQILGRSLMVYLDTGCSVTVLDTKFERFLNGNPMMGTAFTPHGSNLVFRHYRAPLKGSFGGIPIVVPSTAVLDLGALSEVAGIICDGVLGRDALTNKVLDVSFRDGTVALREAAPKLDADGTSIEFRFNEERGNFEFIAEIPGVGTIRLEVDTGSASGISLSPADWERLFPNGVKKEIALAVMDISGNVQNTIATRLPRFIVGKNTYRDLLCIRQGERSDHSTVGIPFLKKHDRIVFDYPSRRLHFSKANRRKEELDMSGLIFRWRNSEAPVLAAPRSGSPAERAGLREGDVMHAINSTPVLKLGAKRVRELFEGGDGRSLRITVVREGKIEEFRIVLKRRI